MAFIKSVCFTFVVLFYMVFESGDALRCYECNSHNDTRCSLEELPDDLIKQCPDKNHDGKPYILCRKIKQMIDFEVNGLPPDNRVIRSCGWDDSNYKNRCYHRSGFGGRQEVCACEGDKCNGADHVSQASYLMLLTLAAVKLYL